MMLINEDNSDIGLAINGGSPVRDTPMPARHAIGPEEKRLINQTIDHYEKLGLDPGYQGVFEERYCAAFSAFMGGGYADAVATGTVSVFVALLALDLPKGSHIIVSPITDPGTLSAIIMCGLTPRLVDTVPGSYNVGVEQLEARIDDACSALVLVHSVGRAAEVDRIMEVARAHGIKVLEDCSQAHGAKFKGKRVGTFGDIAAFSTMYRKASITGASGGVVFTQNEHLYHNALAHADRGKPRWRERFDDRDPSHFLFPALNLHTDEISCAIGEASLARLDDTRARRLDYVKAVHNGLESQAQHCRTHGFNPDDSPFILPVFVDQDNLSVDKVTFARAVLEEGIGLNPDYRYLVSDWPWVKSYLSDNFECANARAARDSSFNLYLNENYGAQEAADTVEAILKVEKAYGA